MGGGGGRQRLDGPLAGDRRELSRTAAGAEAGGRLGPARAGPCTERSERRRPAATPSCSATPTTRSPPDGWPRWAGLWRSHEFVACRYDNEKLNPAWVQRTHLNPQREGLTAYDYPPFLPHAGGGGLGVRRTVHEAVGGFDESLPALEDTDYCWRIQLAGHGFHFAPDAVVNIRHRHDPRSIFRQGVSYGRHNVLIYSRYRPRGMPRLGVLPGVLRWGKLLLKTPLMLLTREGRSRWLWQMGWRLGRIQGCFVYRVVAP